MRVMEPEFDAVASVLKEIWSPFAKATAPDAVKFPVAPALTVRASVVFDPFFRIVMTVFPLQVFVETKTSRLFTLPATGIGILKAA